MIRAVMENMNRNTSAGEAYRHTLVTIKYLLMIASLCPGPRDAPSPMSNVLGRVKRHVGYQTEHTEDDEILDEQLGRMH
jgi:hypothetical protein